MTVLPADAQMISPASGLRLRAMVPPGERWLAMLHAGMLRVGLPVRDCVLGGGRLTISLGESDPLEIVLEPPSADRPSYRLLCGGKWALSYRGSAEPGQSGSRALQVFSAIVGRLEDRIPHDLAGFASIVEEGPDPKSTLARMYPFVTIEESTGPAGPTMEVLARTISRCNHACPFCSAPDLREPGPQVVKACVRDAAELLPGATFSLTGGEPSLKESFFVEARAALAEPGIGHVQIQTNASSFAARMDPGELEVSDRLSFFVSLHGTDPKVHDLCTGTKGQLPLTMKGIDRILAAGHRVTLNTVISTLNIGHLEELAATLPLGPSKEPILWHLSALICPEGNPRAAEYLVAYSELVPAVMLAAEVASARGIETSSLLSSTHAAVPPCVLPEGGAEDRRWLVGEVKSARSSAGAEGGADRGEATAASDRMKGQECVLCRENERCPGVPRAYGLRFGFSELRPLRAPAVEGEGG